MADAAVYQESRRRPTRATAGWLVLALLLAATPAAAEITASGERPAAGEQRVGSLEGDVRVRCWQEGREIVSEAAFASATIPPELRERGIRLDGGGRTAVLLPLADTFCLLTISP
jgi:hypothetical protein